MKKTILFTFFLICFYSVTKAQVSFSTLTGIYSGIERKTGYTDSLYLYADSSYRYAAYIPEIKQSESTKGKWEIKKNKLILGGQLSGMCTIILDSAKSVEKLILIKHFGYKLKKAEQTELRK